MNPNSSSSHQQGSSSGCKILSQLRSLRLQVHHEEAQLLTLNETWCLNHMSWNMNPMHPNSSSSHQQGNSSGCKILSQLRGQSIDARRTVAHLLTLNETWCPNHMS